MCEISVLSSNTYEHLSDLYRPVLDTLAESSIREDTHLPVPNASNTLRWHSSEQTGNQMDGLRLACSVHEYDVKFFGL